jgi:hypothetical protein
MVAGLALHRLSWLKLRTNMSELIPIQQLRERLGQTAFAVWLGLVLESSEDSGVVFRMPRRPEILGSPSTDRVEGSIVRVGRTMATADARMYDDKGTLLASGRALLMHVDR